MAHKYEKELFGLVEQLKAIDATMPPEMANIQNRIKHVVDTQIGYINGIRGVYEGIQINRQVQIPLTHIMGVPITAHKPIEKADILPTDEEKTAFMQMFQPLWDKFLTSPNEELVAYAATNGSLLRACGKKAGYPEYDTAKLGINYIKAVKQLMQLKNDTEAAVKKIEHDTAKLNA